MNICVREDKNNSLSFYITQMRTSHIQMCILFWYFSLFFKIKTSKIKNELVTFGPITDTNKNELV